MLLTPAIVEDGIAASSFSLPAFPAAGLDKRMFRGKIRKNRTGVIYVPVLKGHTEGVAWGGPSGKGVAMKEERIGTVTHYYSHLGVTAISLTGPLRVGDTIHIKGHTTDFTQKIDSLQKEHHNVEKADNGESVGIKVIEHTREHDAVYKVLEG